MSAWQVFQNVAEICFLAFSIAIVLCYIALATVSYFGLDKYMKRRTLERFEELISSEMVPSVSLIAPAYNEGLTIVENIRSMLSLHYNNYDVIVVNDGSKDDTIEKVVSAFDLVEVPFFVNSKVTTQEILSVYKSSNKAYRKLIFVNKRNGGKADALNAGINVSG